MNEELFCALARGIAHETIFEIKDNKQVDLNHPKLSELFKLSTPRPVFSQLWILEGAT